MKLGAPQCWCFLTPRRKCNYVTHGDLLRFAPMPARHSRAEWYGPQAASSPRRWPRARTARSPLSAVKISSVNMSSTGGAWPLLPFVRFDVTASPRSDAMRRLCTSISLQQRILACSIVSPGGARLSARITSCSAASASSRSTGGIGRPFTRRPNLRFSITVIALSRNLAAPIHTSARIAIPADMQAARSKLDLAPLQMAQLRSPQAMPIADQDHGRVAMAVATRLTSSRY